MSPLPSLPRLPYLPDPLRRISVARDLDPLIDLGPEERPATPRAPAAQQIWQAALYLYRSGVHPAVQVCVRHQGRVVLDRAIGHARGHGPHDPAGGPAVAITRQTPIQIFSGAKAVTATVVHLLSERGALDIEKPVAHYIPAYARHGKGGITIAHVLSHRAAVPNLPREAMDLDRADDAEHILSIICDARPFAKPGRHLAYHAVSGGFILGAVVRQATGLGVRELFATEIAEPLGLNVTGYGVPSGESGRVALNYVTGPPTAPPLSGMLTRALGLPLQELVDASNDARFLAAEIPSANVVTTANELSRFYEMLLRGGELDGVRVMSASTIRRAMREQSHLEVDLSLGFPTRFSYGYMLGARVLSLYGRDTQHAFGHLGFTNIIAWADPERALSVAILTTGKPIVYPELARFYGLVQRITSQAPKVSGAEMAVWDPVAGRPD